MTVRFDCPRCGARHGYLIRKPPTDPAWKKLARCVAGECEPPPPSRVLDHDFVYEADDGRGEKP